MQIALHEIPLRETLHFLGWRGTPLDRSLVAQIQAVTQRALDSVDPRVVYRRLPLSESFAAEGTAFSVQGDDAAAMLQPCHEIILFAATLGAQSERALLKEQARDSAQAMLLDAVFSAAVEELCDQAEKRLRQELTEEGLYLTDRFSPGYGDMPLEQTRTICDVLNTNRSLGLTVSASGIMIPRKSVTAVMGISKTPVRMRPRGCEGCAMRGTCPMRRNEESYDGKENHFA